MKIVVLMNASAGAMTGTASHDAAVEAALGTLRAGGLDVQLRRAGRGGDEQATLAEAAARAARDGVAGELSAVIAAGGDGTVGTVAGAMAGTGVPMGVLPAGTLNHFARDLRLPAALPEAAAALAAALSAGRVREVDVGEVNGHVFVNNSSIGLYPRIVARRDRQLRRWREQGGNGSAGAAIAPAMVPAIVPAIAVRLGRGKWLAMLMAAVAVFRRHTALTLRLNADGGVTRLRTPFVFVGNNSYPIDLFSLGERSRLDAGELCLYAARRSGRFSLLRLALRAAFGRLRQDADFASMTVRELRIESRRKTLPVALDGEVIRLRPPLHYRVRPGALKVLAPPGT